MENSQVAPSPVAVGIRFGLMVAMVGTIVDFALRMLGTSILLYGIVLFTLSIVVAVVGIVLAHRAFRKANGNLLTLGQGVLIAVVIMLISSVVSVLFNYVYVNYIDPEFVERMKTQMTDFMERNGVSGSQVEDSTAKLEDLRPPLPKALLKAVLGGLLGGGFLGLIISLFTKRKPADFA